MAAAPNHALVHVVEDISQDVKSVSMKYFQLCFILDALIPSGALKAVLNGTNSVSKIFNDALGVKKNGSALLYYALKVTEACNSDLLERLKSCVKNPYTVPKDCTPDVRLREMILKIIGKLATDGGKSAQFVNAAGATFSPRVTIYQLDPQFKEDQDSTKVLIKFFEKAEEQLKLEPENLDNLRKWLNDVGYQKLVKHHLKNFDPEAEIKILADEHSPIVSKGKNPSIVGKDKNPPIVSKDKNPPIVSKDKNPPIVGKDKNPPIVSEDSVVGEEHKPNNDDLESYKHHSNFSKESSVEEEHKPNVEDSEYVSR